MEKRPGMGLVMGLVLISVIILIALGAVIYPDLFWDRFLWRFYWAPIVADAGGDAGGITSSYNMVDTISYGIILAACAYYIHGVLVRRKLSTGLGFFLALFPVILIGPGSRVLEDMEFFNEPLQYLFISPLIYILLGISTLLSILMASRLENSFSRPCREYRIASSLFLLVPGLLAALVLVVGPWTNETIPFIPVLLISLAFSVPYYFLVKTTRWEMVTGVFWAEWLSVVVYIYLFWWTKGAWYEHYLSLGGGGAPETNFWPGMGIIALTGAVTLAVVISLGLASRRWRGLGGLLSGVNLLIIGGHMLDASATFIGVDFFGYIEKHTLPSFLIDLTGSAWIMYPLKLVFIIPVLYVIDVWMGGREKSSPQLVALVKLTILVLGMAPGTRDLLRLMVGV